MATVQVTDCVVVPPFPSSAPIVPENVPAVVAVPVHPPEDASVKPVGAEPESTDHESESPSASEAAGTDGAEPVVRETVEEDVIVGAEFVSPIENDDGTGEPIPSETVAENEKDWFEAVPGGVCPTATVNAPEDERDAQDGKPVAA